MNGIFTLSLWISEKSLEVFSITTKLSQEEVTFRFLAQAKQTWDLQAFRLFPVLRATSHLIGLLLGLLQFAIVVPALGKCAKIGQNISDKAS